MENQLGASKSPLSPPQPKDKRTRLHSSTPPSKINIIGPHPSMKNDNIPWLRRTTEPMRRPNRNGKNKIIDVNMQREKETDEQTVSEGVKKLVQEYYKKNPGHGWTVQEHELFLMGLMKYGTGNYGKISKKFVKTKNPQQVENHADLVFQIRGQLLKSSTRKGSNTKVGIAKSNPAAPNTTSTSYLVVPYVADAASGTNGEVEQDTNASVVDQIIGTTSRTRPLDLFPTLSEPKRALIMFPVTAPTFPVRSETGSSNGPPYAYGSNLQDIPSYGRDFFPSYELDLDLHLGSWYFRGEGVENGLMGMNLK